MATFCLIHGKWHDSSCWNALAERLRDAGHDVLAPDLPLHDPRTTYAERARPAIESVAGADAPVIVVGHSLGVAYSPLVADAVPGASLVYLCPAPTGPFDVTAPMRPYREGFPFPSNRPDGTSAWEPEAAIAAMYPRLPADTARAVAADLRPGASAQGPYPLDAAPDVPTSVIYAAHDEFFPPEWSRWAAREIAGVEPVELDTGHFAMLEAPDVLAELLQP